MGTIIERPRKNGSVAYLAQIGLMREGKIVHRESKTFDRRVSADAWIKRREADLAKPNAVLGAAKVPIATLGDAIQRYIRQSERAMGRTKTQVLRSILTYDLASMVCAEIGSQHYLEFAQDLVATGIKPQTVENYLSHLGAVVSIARPAWGFALDPQALSDSRKVARALGVTRKGGKRSRRPTFDELSRLLTHFLDREKRKPGSTPMAAIIVFALFSTRRLDEITRIVWNDLNESASRVWVRDMKNPGEKEGNDVLVDLPPEALRIVQAQPRKTSQIFPFKATSISTAFTRACAILGIQDLHFHDLRHEGVSRLFEKGLSIPHVAIVSGHRSWQSLQRYTHIRQVGDKYVGWQWLDIVAPLKSVSS